jgi:hypothetical protein
MKLKDAFGDSKVSGESLPGMTSWMSFMLHSYFLRLSLKPYVNVNRPQSIFQPMLEVIRHKNLK